MQQPKLLHEGAFAYSDMVRTNTDHLEYDLPPRLTQTVKFSTDLSVWNTSLPQFTITQSGLGITAAKYLCSHLLSERPNALAVEYWRALEPLSIFYDRWASPAVRCHPC